MIDGSTRTRLIEEHPSSAEVIKPFLRGRDVKRWRVEFEDQYLIKIESSENKSHPWTGRSEKEAEKIFAKTYPAIHDRFRKLRTALKKRDDQGKFFWELRSCVYWQEFEQPKIVVPAIVDTVSFAPDYDRYFTNNKTTIYIPPSVPLALAVCNSPITLWYAKQTFATKQGGFLDFEPRYSSQVPIPEVSAKQRDLLERIVGYLLWLYRSDIAAVASVANYYEQLLNGLVYELFFPDDLHAQKLFFFEYAEKGTLPDITKLAKTKRTGAIQETFEAISNLNHPIRSCLFSLRALEVVRLIEGEE